MFSKKIRIKKPPITISVATALVLMAIDDIIQDSHESEKVVYGYQIMSHLKDNYNWSVKSGTVYPILKKLNKEFYIKKGVGPENENNRRPTIFYAITKKGKKLVDVIRSLNDEALDAALNYGESKPKSTALKILKQDFPSENIADEYLGPLLRDYCLRITDLASKVPQKKLSDVEQEVRSSIEKLDSVKALLENELEKIETLKRL